MEDVNNEPELDTNYNSDASVSGKRKREGKLRSKVWQHFTKIIKEDGKCEKCQCNHCHKLFTCSSRSGTTHLLRHITDGICSAFRKEKDRATTISGYVRGSMEPRNSLLPWKFDQGLGQSSTQQFMDVEVELHRERIPDIEPLPQALKIVDECGGQSPVSRGKLPQQRPFKSLPKGEAWMNEFRNCVAKLVELTNGRIPVGSLQSPAASASASDYSLAAALKYLNEMEDIPQSSEMYLDAVEILQDGGERECFISLPPEPRRRWLQRVLHHRHPLRYASNL